MRYKTLNSRVIEQLSSIKIIRSALILSFNCRPNHRTGFIYTSLKENSCSIVKSATVIHQYLRFIGIIFFCKSLSLTETEFKSSKQSRILLRVSGLAFQLVLRDIRQTITFTLCGFVPCQRSFEDIAITMPKIVRVTPKALKGHSKVS